MNLSSAPAGKAQQFMDTGQPSGKAVQVSPPSSENMARPVPPFDPGPLDETGQPAVFIHRADPPGDAAVLGQGVFQGEGPP